MDDTTHAPTRARHWTRVEPVSATVAARRETPGRHEFAVYPARVVRCSCGATILATEPEALEGAMTDLTDAVWSLHASWCDELEVADFAAEHGIEDMHQARLS